MKVRMLVSLSGVHDGEHWPAKGEELAVADAAGKDLCAAGLAEPVAEQPAPEKATARKTAEKRA